MDDVVILGSGPAGLTAAIYTSRASLKTVVLGGAKWGGQLMLTTEVENFPGFPKGILGPELMSLMRKQAERFGAKIIEKEVVEVDFAKRPFVIRPKDLVYRARAVIIATGASTRWLNIPGEKRLIGRGVSSCAPCDAFFFKDKRVIVVGGGDSAMEEALVLTKFASAVTIVHRRDQFRASKIMQERVFKNKKIKILWNTVVKEVVGKDKVTAVRLRTWGDPLKTLFLHSTSSGKKNAPSGETNTLKLKNSQETRVSYSKRGSLRGLQETPSLPELEGKGKTWQMPVDGVFVAIGHEPKTEIFRTTGLELDEKGFVKRRQRRHKGSELIKYWTATNIDGIFVAGDVHDYNYRQAVTAAGFGCMAALDAQKWLEEN